MPAVDRILETALYVDDLDRATAFYAQVLGLAAMDAGVAPLQADMSFGFSMAGLVVWFRSVRYWRFVA